MSDPGAFHWHDLPAEDVLPGISRQVLHGERQTMVRYVYQPGAVFPQHSHPEEQITVVISGRIQFDVAGRIVELGPGGVAVLPSYVPHGAVVLGDEAVETFNAMSPRRDSSPSFPSGEGREP